MSRHDPSDVMPDPPALRPDAADRALAALVSDYLRQLRAKPRPLEPRAPVPELFEPALDALSPAATKGIWVLDAHDRTVHVNATMAQILRHPVGDVLDVPFWRFMLPEHGTAVIERVRRQPHGVRRRVCFRLVSHDEPERRFSATAAPLPGVTGRSGDVVLVFDASRAAIGSNDAASADLLFRPMCRLESDGPGAGDHGRTIVAVEALPPRAGPTAPGARLTSGQARRTAVAPSARAGRGCSGRHSASWVPGPRSEPSCGWP